MGKMGSLRKAGKQEGISDSGIPDRFCSSWIPGFQIHLSNIQLKNIK
jgi:hypothetical protein